MSYEIVFDTETTGLNAQQDRIVEIGAVELFDRMPTGEKLHLYINPQRSIDAKAQKVHGLTREFLAKKPTFKRIARKFLDFIGTKPLIAHNAQFDIRFVNAELARLDLPALTNEVIDTMDLSRERRPGKVHTLDAICSHYKISTKKREEHHGALIDSEILAEAYVALRGGRQFGLDLTSPEPKPEWVQPVYPKRFLPPAITFDEAMAHEEFIESLGAKSIWRTFDDETLNQAA